MGLGGLKADMGRAHSGHVDHCRLILSPVMFHIVDINNIIQSPLYAKPFKKPAFGDAQPAQSLLMSYQNITHNSLYKVHKLEKICLISAEASFAPMGKLSVDD